MANSAVMTLRLAPELLSELKVRARAEGRSTSAEVIHLLERVIRVPLASAPAKRSTMGMFAEFDVPELSEFQDYGRALTRAFEASLAESIERYHRPEVVLEPKPMRPPRTRGSRAKSR
jgi:plasmid stability protein